MVGEKETFHHHWYNEWGHVVNRKVQQNSLFQVEGKLYSLGGKYPNLYTTIEREVICHVPPACIKLSSL